MGTMAARRDHRDLRAGDALAPQRRVGGGEDFIVRSPNDMRGHRDAMQPFLQRRIEPARFPAELHGRHAILKVDVDLRIVRRRRLQQRLREALIVVAVADRLLRR